MTVHAAGVVATGWRRLPTNAHHLDPSAERSKFLSGTGQQLGGADLLGREREESVDAGAFADVVNRAPQCRLESDGLWREVGAFESGQLFR
jgi:hypothetical protein